MVIGQPHLLLQTTSSSNRSTMSTWWKLLRSLKVPPKLKVFSWKACHEWLPTYYNLASHLIVVHQWCPDCYQQDETTFHALWGCPKIKTARHSFLPLRDVQMSAAGSFMNFIHYCQVRIISTNWRNFLSFCGATGFVEIVLFSIPLA
ncbi:hypothetical protein ACOSQ2_014939 [Xanthoceras sorbifolium]